MKYISLLVALFLFMAFPVVAQDAKSLTGEQCYQHFEKYSPKGVVAQVRAVVQDLSQNREKALPTYNSINDKSWPEVPLSPIITVLRCDEMRAVAFPIKEMQANAMEKHFFKKFVDANGQYTFAKACSKLKGQTQAVWVLQSHYWIQCEGVLRMGVLFMKVPNTPWVVQASLPNDKYSLEQLNLALSK